MILNIVIFHFQFKQIIMKNSFGNKICFIFCLALFSIHVTLVQGEGPKLLLHLDVNKTLIAFDSANNLTTEDTLNALLAEKYTYKWLPEMKEPISYQTYVEEYLLPGLSLGSSLKKKRREVINHFVSFLQETHHPLECQVVETFHLLNSKFQNTWIFPSFLKLVEKLKEVGVEYTIILRTFGNDLNLVKSAFLQVFPGDPFCAKGHFEKGKLYFSTETLSDYYDDYLEMYLFFKSLTGHLAIQDNWKEWSHHFGSREYSKKFPLDLKDRESSLCFLTTISEKSLIRRLILWIPWMLGVGSG